MYKYQYFKVDVYSHFVKMTFVTPRGREVINGFLKNYSQWGLVREGRRYIRKITKVFAGRVRDFMEYRIHINQYEAFLTHLANLNITSDLVPTTTHIPPEGDPVDISVLPGWIPRDYQEPIVEYLESPYPNSRKLVEIQPGKGKSLGLFARIKIPGGWKFMGDIQVGDTVTAWDGTPTKVTGVYPQGTLPLYEVTFADGRSVEACGEHLWQIYRHNTTANKHWRVENTAEIQRLLGLASERIYVKLIEPENTPDVDLPMDPYTLGVILGDGTLRVNTVGISTPDQFIIDKVKAAMPESLKLTQRNENDHAFSKSINGNGENEYRLILRELGLTDQYSQEKFVPEIYLSGSKQQRLELLQGLMDTDGTVSKNEGSVSYSTTSIRLAENVQYLVRSMGGIATLRPRQTKFTYLGEKKIGRLCYEVDIRHKQPSELFQLPRKKDLTNDDNQYSKTLKLRVESIKYIGDKPAQCISVDHPDRLFVTNDFIVTHNTFLAANRAATTGRRVVVILKPQYMKKWADDFEKICGIPKTETMRINGSAELMSLIATAKEGRLKARIIIISNKTLQNWFKLYERKGEYSLSQGYDCYPEELLPLLGAGIRIIDEVHQDFHLNFKMDLYCHCPLTISLSATLISDDPFLRRMYEVGYPINHRYAGLEYDKYIESTAMFYSVKRPDKLKTSEWGSTTYSHHAFESSIIKDPMLLQGYFGLIDAAIRDNYLKDYKQGNRLLVYCASINLCTLVTEHLKKTYVGKDIRRYVEDDPYENLMEAEISVSTLMSAGTGHDVNQLSTVILTTAVSSSASNIQGFGRLRNLPVTNPEKYGDVKLRFIYFVCTDVSKHVDYHIKKKELLMTRALVYGSSTYPIPLG